MSQADTEVADLYLTYDAWKQWGDPFRFTRDQAESFAGEFRGIPLKGATVLEVGFGKGALLAWARSRGATIVGSELVASSLQAAAKEGVETLPASFETVAAQNADRFDVIVAFDVFEHFTWADLVARLRAARTMLKPGGRIVLRFPNGQSPFGLVPQNGDATHLLALSRGKIEQAIQGGGLQVERYRNAYRPVGLHPLKAPVRLVRYALRSLVRVALNFTYAHDAPLDPVVTIVLRKTA